MKYFSFLYPIALTTMTALASATPVEIQFQGVVDSLTLSQNVHSQIESQYAPSNFLNATSFTGVLKYDDNAAVEYQSSGGSSVYKSSIHLTVADSYTIQGEGLVSVSNDYGDHWWDSIDFVLNNFSTPFITPDNEMEFSSSQLGVSFYDHSSSVLSNQALPSASSFPALVAFDYLPVNLMIQSSANAIVIPCDGIPSTGEPCYFYPSQGVNLQGHISAISLSEVPLPSSAVLLTPALLILLKRRHGYR